MKSFDRICRSLLWLCLVSVLPVQGQMETGLLRENLARAIARVRDLEQEYALLRERYETQQALVAGRAMREQLPAGQDPLLAWSYNDAGLLLAAKGLPTEAEVLYREALAILDTSYAAELPARGTVLQNLAEVLWRQRKTEAFRLFQEAEGVFVLLAEGQHPRLGALWNSWAGAAAQAGRVEEAETLYRKSIDLYAGLAERFDVVVPLHNLAVMLLSQGRTDEAGSLLQEALQVLEAGGQGASDWAFTVLQALVRQSRAAGAADAAARYEKRVGALAVQRMERLTERR